MVFVLPGGREEVGRDRGPLNARRLKNERSRAAKRKSFPNYWPSTLLASPQETPRRS